MDRLPTSLTRRSRPAAIAAAGLAVIALGVTACGSSSSSSGSGSGSGSGASSGTAAAQAPAKPAAPEVSPQGDIPDNQAYVAYAPPGLGFSVKVPEGWSRTSAGGATTFTDKLNSIRMEQGPAARHAGQASTVQRTAGSAQRLTYTTTSAPNAVTGKTQTDAVERYVFTHNGKTAVLTLTGPKGADNVDPWKIVTDSFRWTR
ncbi:MAG TPA: hypothetical protein VGO71_06860 [Baekduia sp.]|jgi:hypothetical protein|nr:hypothetical protein [Baekduia sp.]